ncbi:MAG: spore maturation protein A, partial [Oscillospiraceae bacterium]|nr:spore maturation protein A [Oscillospiraceae bacterium]
MAMGIIWTGMVAVSVLCGLATGSIDAVAAGALEGAAAAVELCLAMTGALCLWMRVREEMGLCVMAAGLARWRG